MNIAQYLLARLAEEGVEVAKDALKAQAFGIDDRITFNPKVVNTNPADPTNRDRLVDELNDLLGVARMLVAIGVLPKDWENQEAQLRKCAKVRSYEGYARLKGELDQLETFPASEIL